MLFLFAMLALAHASTVVIKAQSSDAAILFGDDVEIGRIGPNTLGVKGNFEVSVHSNTE